jgi:hypothetical protein
MQGNNELAVENGVGRERTREDERVREYARHFSCIAVLTPRMSTGVLVNVTFVRVTAAMFGVTIKG